MVSLEESIEIVQEAVDTIQPKWADKIDFILDEMKNKLEEKE